MHKTATKPTLVLRQLITAMFLALGAEWALAQPAPEPPEALEPPVRESIVLARETAANSEQWERFFGQTMVRNVHQPNLYPVEPKDGKANGRAVIVVPGGGYQFVSMESEGFLVAERLADAGYTAFVLKYRTVPTPRDGKAFMQKMAALFGNLGKGELTDNPAAVADLASALNYVQNNADAYDLQTGHIGVIGFSAGSRTLIRFLEQYPEAKTLDHAGLIYPPMSQTVAPGPRPPLFMAIAVDDPLFKQGGLNMLGSWLNESDAVEFHLYSGGQHGFGMRPTGNTSDHWIDQYLAWLKSQYSKD